MHTASWAPHRGHQLRACAFRELSSSVCNLHLHGKHAREAPPWRLRRPRERPAGGVRERQDQGPGMAAVAAPGTPQAPHREGGGDVRRALRWSRQTPCWVLQRRGTYLTLVDLFDPILYETVLSSLHLFDELVCFGRLQIGALVKSVNHTLRNLERWAAPEKVSSRHSFCESLIRLLLVFLISHGSMLVLLVIYCRLKRRWFLSRRPR